MITAKTQAIKMINDLPDNASWEDIMYKFYVSEKIENALNDAKEENFISHEEAKARLMS